MRCPVRFAFIMLAPLGLMASLAAAAAFAAPQASPVQPDLVRDTILRNFGSHFTAVAKFQPMVGDFDGDGAEDLAVVATSDNPVLDEGAYDYKFIDPYDSFFGYGDAKTMMSFKMDPGQPAILVLIVHDWRAAHPKAKFVVVNLPFVEIAVGSGRLGKKKKMKIVATLFTKDSTGVQAEVFWDGRRYRWAAVGAD